MGLRLSLSAFWIPPCTALRNADGSRFQTARFVSMYPFPDRPNTGAWRLGTYRWAMGEEIPQLEIGVPRLFGTHGSFVSHPREGLRLRARRNRRGEERRGNEE